MRPAGEVDRRPFGSFLTDAHGRDHVSKAALALDRNGKILGLRVKTIANIGAYMSTFSSSVPTYLYATLLSGQYDIAAIYAEVDAVYTNTSPVDAYRGAGRPEATYVVERLVEEAARQLKIDPAELRRRNFINEFPHQTPVIMTYDIGDYDASLDRSDEARRRGRISRRARPPPRTRQAARSRATRPISRRAASRRRRRSARSAPAWVCGNPPRCASIRPARWKF